MSIKEHPPHHVPVLCDAVLRTLKPMKGESYLDLTAGYGGHASAILNKTGNITHSTLVDRDAYAVSKLSGFSDKGANVVHNDFVSASQDLINNLRKFDLILVDLGVSSPQLDQAARGFSFLRDGPLDMRMDRRQELTAALFINTASVEELTQVIHLYGEEPIKVARRYASEIVANRPLSTTFELAEVILNAHVGPRQKRHPATRTFQAIRIAVNQELKQIEKLLPMLPKLLERGGRVGVISFHSLEDRLVKEFFKVQTQMGYEAELKELTKKPISGDEDVHNPRSRSAKLRVAVKI